MNNQKIENTVERRFWKKFFLVCLAISFFLVLALRVSSNTILDFLLLWFVIASFVFAFGFGVIMQWKEWIDKNKPQLEYDYVFQIANRYCCEDIEKAYIMDRIHRLHLNEIKTSIKQIKLENKLDVDFFVDDEEGIVKFEDAQNKFDQIMHILKDDRNKITYLNLDDFGTHEIERLSDLLTQQNNKFEGIEFTKWLDLEDEENLEEKRLEEKRSELEKNQK